MSNHETERHRETGGGQTGGRQTGGRQTGGIAVVGMACRYPDAETPEELWENVLSGRRAFRRIPDERTPLADYFSPDASVPDRFYAPNAALIEGYEFDRVGFRIAGSTYRSTDLTHWLALDMATRALADAGFPGGDGLPRQRTAVVIGNTLTGEFTRAGLMRLRWPYVRRTVGEALRRRLGLDTEALTEFLDDLEETYKQPFPPVDADSLAGGLANTIAGRICNYFDLGGGGYTVDGACSSSLLSVAHACDALVNGDADIAIAGGVDLSIDPFELVGFAKTGALATTEMRVYDRNSAGFWPGEGCGILVLARAEDADALRLRTYARIAGWGISSDGRGGITRPEVAGQLLALERAYEMAGFGAHTVGYVEGHGTGTAVGDATEIRTLTAARTASDPSAPPAVLGTVKANIGHTKAAAGVAGLIKAVFAVHRQVIPPTTGCVDPHPELADAAVRVTRQPEAWPDDRPIRAGVSSMGFGGINAHIALESGERAGPRAGLPAGVAELARSTQDAELLLFDADTPEELRSKVADTARLVLRLSYANLGDLAARLAGECREAPLRAAVVASDPGTARRRLLKLGELLDSGARQLIDPDGGLFAGRVPSAGSASAGSASSGSAGSASRDGATGRVARVGLLFPGQGSGRGGTDTALRRRFGEIDRFYAEVSSLPGLAAGADGERASDTSVAQPRIAAGSVAALMVLERLGITADVAVGHSLGELGALHWAGVLDAESLVRVAAERGRLMTETSAGEGAMVSIAGTREQAEKLIQQRPVVIAGLNSPRQTVLAGPAAAIDDLIRDAEREGVRAIRLPVSHAFHSPQVAPAADRFAEFLAGQAFGAIRRPVVSSVTAGWLPPDEDVRELLRRQVVSPVRFAEAVREAASDVDLLIEAGPGSVLTGLARETVAVPVVPLETDAPTVRGMLRVAAACHVIGVPFRPAALFEGRHLKPLPERIRLLANPCESVPAERDSPDDLSVDSDASDVEFDRQVAGAVGTGTSSAAAEDPDTPGVLDPAGGTDAAGGGALAGAADTVELVRRLAAERAELPVEAVRPDSALLDELHLSSITVGQLVNEALRARGLPPPANPMNFATATVESIARTMDELAAAPEADQEAPAGTTGVDTWIRAFVVQRVPAARPVGRRSRSIAGEGHNAGQSDHGQHGQWELFAPDRHPVAEPLTGALRAAGIGNGVLVCLPTPGSAADDVRQATRLALSGAQAAARLDPPARFVLLHHGADHGAAAIAKTLHLEDPRIDTLVVEAPPTVDSVERIVEEVAAASGYVEVGFDESGERVVPRLSLLPDEPGSGDLPSALPLGSDDVLLVTGGGKGITAECALSLARRTGVRVGLLGRSDPGTDAELAGNLERFAASGVAYRYLRADVTDPAATGSALSELEREFGPVTAILHGAGRNLPRRLTELDAEELEATLAPKVDGLEVVLDAVDRTRLRLLVGFGSIIGRAGLAGEAHYAAANAAMTERIVEFGERYPGCRCLALEWSVWAGVGMGERLGVVESLRHNGITPIGPDEGIGLLHRLLARRSRTPVALVVTGRIDRLPTVALERPELPLRRFLERVLLHYPGVELVCEADLSTATDPYLADHELEGNLVFPAVLGMEAMAQVAEALSGSQPSGGQQSGGQQPGGQQPGTRPRPVLRDAEFARPIVVPANGALTIRIAALVREPGVVDVVVRSAETGFAVEHFRATCRLGGPDPEAASRNVLKQPQRLPALPTRLPPVPLDPAGELYGGMLFQGSRFQRLAGYRRIGAAHCVADIDDSDDHGSGSSGGTSWFGGFLPDGLELGDPGVRDTFMQAIQGSRPDQVLLPVRIGRVLPGALGASHTGGLRLLGVERERTDEAVVWDLSVRDESGNVVEVWEGLRLAVVRNGDGPIPMALLGAYLERRLQQVWGRSAVAVTVEPDNESADPAGPAAPAASAASAASAEAAASAGPDGRRERGALAFRRLLGREVDVRHRPDGKPEVSGTEQVSVAHGDGVTVVLSGPGVTCDLEAVADRDAEQWKRLLGTERYAVAQRLVEEHGDDPATAATRLWCVAESEQKAGRTTPEPLTVSERGDSSDATGWVWFAGSGGGEIATYAGTPAGSGQRFVFAFRRTASSGGQR